MKGTTITVDGANHLAIRTVDLVKNYGTKGAPVPALRGVSIELRRGEKVALVGKSGSGKSTLLNLLGGMDRPTSGRIEVFGQDLAGMNSNQLAHYRLTAIGLIFQSYNLIPSKTALQNVELPMVFAGRSPAARRVQARQALEALGLGPRLHHRPAELSGGEIQRVAIARALVNQPGLILADEPTGNLDSVTAGDIRDLLLDHVRRHGATLVLVTHDEELAGRCADRLLRLHDGHLVS